MIECMHFGSLAHSSVLSLAGLSPPANFLQAVLLELSSGSEIFPLDPNLHVAADKLYPDYKYITADEYLDNFVEK